MKKIVIVIGGIIVLGFAYYTISPLFIDKEVNDELPELATQSGENQDSTMPMAFNASGEEVEVKMVSEIPTDMADDMEAVPVGDEFAIVPKETAAMAEPMPETMVRDESFPIIDTAGHPASGQIRVIESPEQSLVRYENYDGTNGPDLYVYLAKDLDADEFVNLGRAKGNKGNINYTVPEEIDLSEYKYVMTWCQRFGVLFDYAEIN